MKRTDVVDSQEKLVLRQARPFYTLPQRHEFEIESPAPQFGSTSRAAGTNSDENHWTGCGPESGSRLFAGSRAGVHCLDKLVGHGIQG